MNAAAFRARRPTIAPQGAIAPGLLWHPGCHCPSCGERKWDVGRQTAECAVCHAPLIIADAQPLNEKTLKGSPPWPNA